MGTWIEIVVVWASQNASGGRSLRGNVDRNSLPPIVTVCALGRSLRGNVDRNADTASFVDLSDPVVPYVGTWIEIIRL